MQLARADGQLAAGFAQPVCWRFRFTLFG